MTTPAQTAERCALGVDIGGTSIRAGVVQRDDGRLCAAVRRVPTPRDGAPTALQAALRELRIELASAGLRWSTVGVALPGLRDPDGRVLRRAVHLPALEGLALDELLGDALGAVPRIETDVLAAGWAQWRALGARSRRFVYLSIGTGIGGAVILDGVLLRHTHGGAGQLGHLLCDPAPTAPPCRCGGQGCLEAIWRAAPRHFGAALAVALVNIVRVYAPSQIVLGGGAVDHAEVSIPEVEALFQTRRDSLFPDELELRSAPLASDEAGVIGAALLAPVSEGRP